MRKYAPHKRTKPGELDYTRESEKKTRKLRVKQRIKKILFRVIFICLLILLFIFFYSHYIFIYARGIVSGEELFYSAPLDGMVSEINVEVYEAVQKDAYLTRITSEELEFEQTRLEQEIESLKNALELKKTMEIHTDIEQEMVALKNSIESLVEEIDVLEKTLEAQQERAKVAQDAYERAEYLVSLEAATQRLAENRHILYIISEANVADVKVRLSTRRAELKTKRQQVEILGKKMSMLGENSPASYSAMAILLQRKKAELDEIEKRQATGTIRATAPCTIDKIYKPVDSYVLKGTPILKAFRSDKPCVIAYVKPQHLRKLRKGQAANILYANISIKGKIGEISESLEPLPGMFRTPFRVRENFGKVKIVPLDTDYPVEIFKPGLQVKVRFLKIFI